MIISTVPIFLLGYARIRFYFKLLIVASPFGLGHVYMDYKTLKSAKLKTNILVSNTIIHLSGFILTAFT
jgi:hypothetical protein